MSEKQLTKRDSLLFLLRQLGLTSGKFTGRVEIHVNQGSIRSILKVESVELAD